MAHVLDINLSGAFFMAQAALDAHAERGTGRIINVSSVIGEIGNIGQANYAASKSGLRAAKTLAGRRCSISTRPTCHRATASGSP